MLSPENREVVIRHVEAETAHRMDETLETLAEDCVFDDRALGRVWHGREGAAQYYRMWWDAFAVVPDTDKRWSPAEDVLIAETVFRGRHQGGFLGVEPTGRQVAVPILIIVDLANGLLKGERFYWDVAGLMKQIGVDTPWAVA